MRTRLIRGRSRASVLLIAGDDAHLFVWAPFTGANSFGACFRYRTDREENRWTHLRLMLMQRNGRRPDKIREGGRTGARFVGRRTLTVAEVDQWTTKNGTRERVGLKRYVRLKVGPGGREAA